MNCPHCQKPVGSHVQAGTEAYYRVSKGLCPHCGCSMPAGFKVDFLASSGRLLSDERTYQETLRQNKSFAESMALGSAQDNHKKILFHVFFGTIGLLPILYLFSLIWDGRTWEETVFKVGDLVFPLIISLIFWMVPVFLLRWHYITYIKDKYDINAARTNCNIAATIKCLSWFIFIFGGLLSLILLA